MDQSQSESQKLRGARVDVGARTDEIALVVPVWPGASTRLTGVIGDPVAHSLSPLLHNTAYRAMGLDWASVAFTVPAGRGAAAVAAVAALGLVGVSVTMPLKEEVAAAVDELTPVAARLGSVNCVVVGPDGQSIGHSTDGAGFVDACRAELGFDPVGCRCVVVGAGGAARAVVDALAGAGASDVAVVGRTPGRVQRAAALAGGAGRAGSATDITAAELVVQATPVGMGAGQSSSAMPFDPELLHPGQLVVDLIYHPARTPLLDAAAAVGARTANGIGMLVYQAAAAVERWTGRPAPRNAMSEAAAAVGAAPALDEPPDRVWLGS